jgi:hypothetical protein
MSATTGPVLTMGAIVILNQSILNDRPFDPRVPIATAITAGTLALAEKAWPAGATALAWTALVAVLLTRITPGVPSPVESLATWWRTT